MSTFQPLSTFGLLPIAVHHLRDDALILLYVLHHGLPNQLENVLSLDAHGLCHLHCQHVCSEDSPFRGLDFGHHRLAELGEKE